MDVVLIVLAIVLPLSQLAPGLWMRFKPPKDINALTGYRTARSSASQEAWDFAQRHIGRTWIWVGLAGLIAGAAFSLVLLLAKPDLSDSTVNTAAMVMTGIYLAALILPIFFTEAALKKNFDAWGRPVNR